MTDYDRTPGTWKLHMFERKLDQWRDETQPPEHICDNVRAWWSCLAHMPRVVGRRVRDRPGVWFAWVPNCGLPDLGDGPRGVQCHYQVIRNSHDVVCQFFVAARMEFPHEADRFGAD